MKTKTKTHHIPPAAHESHPPSSMPDQVTKADAYVLKLTLLRTGSRGSDLPSSVHGRLRLPSPQPRLICTPHTRQTTLNRHRQHSCFQIGWRLVLCCEGAEINEGEIWFERQKICHNKAHHFPSTPPLYLLLQFRWERRSSYVRRFE